MREVDILDLIRKDKTRVQIGEELGAKWNVSPFSIHKQYDKVMRKLQEDLRKERELLTVQLIERNNEIFSRCMAEKKYKTALDANNSIAKIAGLGTDRSKDADEKPKFITVRESDQSKPKLEVVESVDKAENE